MAYFNSYPGNYQPMYQQPVAEVNHFRPLTVQRCQIRRHSRHTSVGIHGDKSVLNHLETARLFGEEDMSLIDLLPRFFMGGHGG